jgi:hypothetical protein
VSERVVFDPSEEATGRVELDITGLIEEAGPDWGDAQIEAYMAEAAVGQVPVDYRVPNRQIQIPLILHDIEGTTFEEARRAVQAKVALFQRQGGWLKREINGTPWFADVMNASLKLGGSTAQAMFEVDVDATLTIETLPDFYGEEVTLDDMSETASAELAKVLKDHGATAVIKGDYPGRVRVVVDDDQNAAQYGLLWGFRSRFYDPAVTAALVYEAEALTPLDAASVTALAGASGGNVVQHPSLLASSWTPVLSTTHAVSGQLTHKGTYRVWARCYSTATAPPRVRLVWDAGDINAPEENAPGTLPTFAFYDLDLGEIRIDEAPVGTHGWTGQVEAMAATSAGGNISIDKLWFVPVDEGYGILRMSPSSLAGTTLAQDSFTGAVAGAALNGSSPPIGTAWATSGAATDFTFLDAGAARSSPALPPTSAAGRSVAGAGFRYGIFGSSRSDQKVSAQVGAWITPPAVPITGSCGIVARWVDANNYLRCTIRWNSNLTEFRVTKVVAGVATVLADAPVGRQFFGEYFTLAMSVSANGNVAATLASSTGLQLASLVASDPALAPGGVLQSGKAGIIDSGDGATTPQRWYDSITVTAPPPEPVVINAGKSVELRTEGHFRKASGGTGYDLINAAVGDLPRVPSSGVEGQPVELFVKPSRGDFDERADVAIDDISVQVFYRPSYLFVPEQS